MPGFKNWFGLADSTFRSLSGRDVARLYSRDWPETRKTLVSDFTDEIERERSKPRRWVRTASAILYGLANRLAPQRRFLFFVALAVMIFVIITGITDAIPDPTRVTYMFLAALALMFLLALELIDKIKFRDELELARELQADLLPKHPPFHPSFEIAAYNHIANTVGGDLYDLVPLEDGRLAILFGDASGHGMTAGLVMAVAHAAFRTQLDIDPSPTAIMSSLNRILCRTGGPRSFFAAVYLLLEADGNFTAAVAGHPPVLRVSREGKILQRLESTTYPLGIRENSRWDSATGTLEASESLLFYSDGLVESRTEGGRDFGFDYVETIAGWNPTDHPSELMDRLLDEWRSFTRGLPPEDDLSLLVVRKR